MDILGETDTLTILLLLTASPTTPFCVVCGPGDHPGWGGGGGGVIKGVGLGRLILRQGNMFGRAC